MYAVRRLYVKNWDSTPKEKRYSVQVGYGGQSIPGIRSERISRVDEEVMYWRKANHIHAWFVDNVQGGEDNCREYYVTEEKLRQLLYACDKVIQASKLVEGTVDAGTVYDKEHPKGLAMRRPGRVIEDVTVAKRLLPTRQGFFFGSYEYDENYLDEVVRTRDWIVNTLADRAEGTPGDIIYSSSW